MKLIFNVHAVVCLEKLTFSYMLEIFITGFTLCLIFEVFSALATLVSPRVGLGAHDTTVSSQLATLIKSGGMRRYLVVRRLLHLDLFSRRLSSPPTPPVGGSRSVSSKKSESNFQTHNPFYSRFFTQSLTFAALGLDNPL